MLPAPRIYDEIAPAGIVKDLAGRGDFVVCLGAGSITQWAYAYPAN